MLRDVLLDHIPEPGIIDEIESFKIGLEDSEFIDNYNENWDLISRNINNPKISEGFIRRHINDINIYFLIKNRKLSDELFVDLMPYLSKDLFDIYIKSNNFDNPDIIFDNKMYTYSDFFLNYFLKKNRYNIHLIKKTDIRRFFKDISDNISIMRKQDLKDFIYSMLKYQNNESELLDFYANDDFKYIYSFDSEHQANILLILKLIRKNTFYQNISENPNQLLRYNFLEKNRKYLIWDKLSYNNLLTESTLYDYAYLFNWDILSLNYPFSENFLIANIKYINMYNLSNNKNVELSKDFMVKYMTIHMINNRIKYQQIHYDIILFNKDSIRWDLISQYTYLTNDFIILYNDFIIWDIFIKHQDNIDNKILDKYHNNIDFDLLAQYQQLDEWIISKYRKLFNWFLISKYQTHLSREFLRKYKKYIYWETAIKYQKNLDLDMIIKTYKYLN